MSISARSFPGGANTDNLATGSTLAVGTYINYYCRFNVTATDATARRFLEISDNPATTNPQIEILINSSHIFFQAQAWTVTAGVWTIALPSTGAEHDMLWTYDASATGNNPVCYLDGASVTVTRTSTPAGAWSPSARTLCVGNANSVDRCFNGWLSTCALWTSSTSSPSSILTQAEATGLHGGGPPCYIRTDILTNYWPCDNSNSPETDTVGGNTLTVTGTTVVTGSTILYASRCTTPCGHRSM